MSKPLRKSSMPLRKGSSSKRSSPSPKGRAEASHTNTAERERDKIRFAGRTFAPDAGKLGDRKLDILPDMPDVRDRICRPHLRALHPAIYPRIAFSVLNQYQDASCTGFSLAHVIDVLRFREVGPDNPQRVSARMLYEMAKRNDEWGGSAYEGSSIRGAIKGFYRNGVCSETIAPDKPGATDWALTSEMAWEAREIRLGAYFRLEPDISDYHAALNEVGVIYVSAQIHSNWQKPEGGQILPGGRPEGGHAFAIVGYDAKGFWILNSWGPDWGNNGIAHWHYRDWAATVMDAWVLQLGVRAPEAFSAVPRVTPSDAAGLFGFGETQRGDIVGHFINIDDGRLQKSGSYFSPSQDEMRQTVERLASTEANNKHGYEHLVIYAHGGLNTLADDAARIATWKRNNIFGRAKAYNIHLMWGSGFIDEAFGEISKSPAAARAGGGLFDWLFEAGPGKALGARAWRNMKQDAKVAFDKDEKDYDGGFEGLDPLLGGLDKAARRPKLHLVGHSAGSIVLGHLLSALARFKLTNLELGSIHLMAPACTVAFFKQHYEPYLNGSGALRLLDRIYLYNLTRDCELHDTVTSNIPLAPTYSRSLLYLVSRAYEPKPETPLAGMQRYAGEMPQGQKIAFAYADQDAAVTASKTHGGFDNDPATIGTILSRIAGSKIDPPSEAELSGY